jgi:serine/threonine protein kinase
MQYSGTPTYMAPELFQKRQYDESVDVFAFGCLLWELVQREVPYDGLDVADIKSKVEAGDQLKLPYGTDPRLVSLISECRARDSASRPSFNRIVEVLSSFK